MSVTTLKDVILSAYAQALLAATQRGMRGEEAKTSARVATARAVSKGTGKAVTDALVLKAVSAF